MRLLRWLCFGLWSWWVICGGDNAFVKLSVKRPEVNFYKVLSNLPKKQTNEAD
jgi:hypothetical protein